MIRPRIRIAQAMAGAIPLIGAILLVAVGPAEVESYGMFRFLVTGAIVSGMVGFSLSLAAAGMLEQTVRALTGQSLREHLR